MMDWKISQMQRTNECFSVEQDYPVADYELLESTKKDYKPINVF